MQSALAGAVLSGCSSGPTSTRPAASPGNPFMVDGSAPVDVAIGVEYGGFAAAAYRK